jgi:hypothetical protein
MQSFALTAFGIGFWVFLTIAAVAGIVSDYKRRQIELEPLRAAIERGAQLDPAVIEKFSTRQPREAPLDPMLLKIGGIITMAAGIGLVIAAWFISRLAPIAFLPLLGTGILAVCVAVGVLVAARVLRRHQQQLAREPGTGGTGA